MTISGTVRDPSGAPAPGVEVTFHPGQYPAAPAYAEARTHKNGRYDLIVKTPPDDNAVPWDGPINPTNAILARDLKRNLAAIGEFTGTPAKMDLNLQPGITLSGLLKDTKGSPVSTASVNLCFVVAHSYSNLGPQPVKVDGQGAFSISALPQGFDYQCGCGAAGFAPVTVSLQARDSQTNQFVFPDVVLKLLNRKIAGHVFGSDGKPVPAAWVGICGELSASTQSDATGHFAFDVCDGSLFVNASFEHPPGSHKIAILRSGTWLPVKAGDTNVVLKFDVAQPDAGAR